MSYERQLAGEIMQKHESGRSKRELPALRITGPISMTRNHRKSLIALVLIASCSLSLASAQETNNSKPKQSPATQTVRTASGIVRGVIEGDVSIFKGIPHAAAPIGDNRWCPPQPLPAWQGVRDASQFGADCAQAAFPPGSAPISKSSSEDCLFVNVWRPAGAAPGAKLAVMVWIHGGAFVFGSGSWPGTSGVPFAKQGVILVTFNYRLGRLGFLTARAFVAKGAPAYIYLFSYVPAATQKRMPYGAPHGPEIAYVFNNLNTRREGTITPEDQKVAQMMNTYWANFAKTGDPNGKGLPKWPVYDDEKNELLEVQIDGTPVGKPDPKKDRLDVIEKAVTTGNLH